MRAGAHLLVGLAGSWTPSPAQLGYPLGMPIWENTMKRRNFLISAAAMTAGVTIMPRLAFAAEGVIDVYFTSDQNVIDFWTNVVKPKFEAANAGITLNLV